MGAENRSLYVTLSANATAFRGQMVGAAASVRQVGTEVVNMSDKQRRAMDDLASRSGRMAAAFAGALFLMGKAAVDWESQWAGVAKTVDGTRGQMDGLEDNLRELARTMPATHEEIAATAEAAGQLGVSIDHVRDFTKIMLELGETTNLTSDQAATSIAQLMNVMKTAPDQVDEIGNTLVDLGNKGASTEAQILDMAQRLAGAGALIGASEADVLGMASAMANLGVESELGGGAMSRVIAIIDTAVSDGAEGLKGFADVAGISADRFASQWERDPVRAIDAFLRGLQAVDQSGGNVISTMADLGIKGTQNRDVMLRLAGSGDMLTTSLDQASAAWEQNTALTDEYRKRAETTGSQIQVAWNRIKDAGIEGGEALLPVVADLAETAGDAADAFGRLPGPVKDAATELIGIAAITGGAAWFGSKVIGGIIDTRQALQELNLTAGQSQAALSSIGKGVQFVALGIAIDAIGDKLDDAFDLKLEGDLDRNLQALANGEVVGNLGNMGDYLDQINRSALKLSDTAFGWVPFADTTWKVAEQEIGKVDEALAQMVESGNADMAADVMAEISKMAAEQGVSMQETTKWFDQYNLALSNVAKDAASGEALQRLLIDPLRDSQRELKDATDATGEYAAGNREAGASAADAGKSIRELTKAMSEQRQAALSSFDAQTAWGRAVADAREAALKGRRGIDALTEGGRENREALSSLAAAWNNLSPAAQNADGRFHAAKRTFLETADAMGVPIEAARRLARQLLELPKSKLIEVEADTGAAMSELDRLSARLRAMDGDTATTYVRTVYQHQNKLPDIPMAGQQNADGGLYVRGRRFADGGFDGDGRYYPRVPQIVRGGANILWGEQETGWEAYISGKPGMERRNVSILGAAASRFGYDLMPRGRESVSVGSTVINHFNQIPKQLELVVDGRSFTAYVRGHAGAVARETYSDAAQARTSSDRKDW